MYLYLSDILNSMLSRWAGVDYLPASLRGIRDSFFQDWGHGRLWVLLLPLGGILVVCLWSWLVSREKKDPAVQSNPTVFFDQLLGQLELSAEEKKLLGQMSRGARLHHPAVMLLSPKMLSVSQALWRKDRGSGVVDSEKMDRLNQICRKLYDHYPTDSAMVPSES